MARGDFCAHLKLNGHYYTIKLETEFPTALNKVTQHLYY